jgi:hypothetical protein
MFVNLGNEDIGLIAMFFVFNINIGHLDYHVV